MRNILMGAPRIYLAILWHQHQPMYKDLGAPVPQGSYVMPWVRLHAIKDYYDMASMLEPYPNVHLTINLVPSLLWQIEDYLYNNATDRALELTKLPTENLSMEEKLYILDRFFDADWNNQINPFPRYRELLEKKLRRENFSDQDITDLKMWFNLAWFDPDFRGEVKLCDGQTVSLKKYFDKQRHFTQNEINEMISEQYKIMANIVPIHKKLQDQGQIEVSTTPFYHPILPLINDSSCATIDRSGSCMPSRYSRPDDAFAQVMQAVEYYTKRFGRPPRGMWPAEGAVGQSIIPLFTRGGIKWIATDKGVLARSGKFGYDINNVDNLCQVYMAEEEGYRVSVFFRETVLSDAIGFKYYCWDNYEAAAQDFVNRIKNEYASRMSNNSNRILSVILDGENAWAAYRNDAKEFLHSLYRILNNDNEIRTVTYSEYIDGDSWRDVSSHNVESQKKVYNLFHGSWIDENSSGCGNDLGTWIGEQEENRAWELLKIARNDLEKTGATPATHQKAFDSVYQAEGSDWFWWYGADQDSGIDCRFDEIYRQHLKNIYVFSGKIPPSFLDIPITSDAPAWNFENQFTQLPFYLPLVVETKAPGTVRWGVNGWQNVVDMNLEPVGGVMAGVTVYRLNIGPFMEDVKEINFTFHWADDNWENKNFVVRIFRSS